MSVTWYVGGKNFYVRRGFNICCEDRIRSYSSKTNNVAYRFLEGERKQVLHKNYRGSKIHPPKKQKETMNIRPQNASGRDASMSFKKEV